MTQEEMWEKMNNDEYGYTLVKAIPDNIDGHHDGFGNLLEDLEIVYIEKQGSWGVESYECPHTGCGMSWYFDEQPKKLKRLPNGNICVVEWF